MVHSGKCYKALIDSGAAISLLRYSTYKKIEAYYKTPIQPTTAKLNTADGSLMSALGTTALHLRIAKFKFTHNFIICDQLPETELILASIFKRNSHYLILGIRKKIATYKEMVNSWFIHTPVIARLQQGQLNQYLGYHPNTMVLCQLR